MWKMDITQAVDLGSSPFLNPLSGPLGWFFWTFLILIAIKAVVEQLPKRKKRRSQRKASNRSTRATGNQTSKRNSGAPRSDDVIVATSLDELSGAEFERLLALYFRYQGYEVREVGVGGNDGGVDLVIIDKRGEKTAVQAKCYSDSNKVSVQTIRELVGAKRNHDCILSLLITTSDLTGPAKKEAEQFKVDYWHGSVLEHKLRSWGKWQPAKKLARPSAAAQAEVTKGREQVAATTSTSCSKCGSSMVKRKNKQGEAFFGCSQYPSCRHTRSL